VVQRSEAVVNANLKRTPRLPVWQAPLWRFGWFRRLMTPTYQCPDCRRSYHYCDCFGPRR
jgi:hypothetical protein